MRDSSGISAADDRAGNRASGGLLAVADRRRLVALRHLLLEAQARTSDGSELGRQVAVLLLDGAGERAMELSARHRGVQRAAANFHKLFGDLRKALPAWDTTGWKGVADLHEARNQVQHSGIPVDREVVPLWAADAERFVRELVAAAFGVELATVSLAEAVEDDPLRRLFEDAERKLEDEDYVGCVKGARSGFNEARRRFGGQLPRTPFSRSSSGDRDLDRYVAGAVGVATDLADVTPFAPDLGEYLWLKKLDDVVRVPGAVTRGDAERALAFCLAWVLRYEAFHSRYGPQPHELLSRVEIPSTGDERAQVSDVYVEGGYEPGSVRVSFQLSDAPPDLAPDHFLNAVRDALHVRLGVPVSWGGDGTVTVSVAQEDLRPDELVETVTAALAEAIDAARAQRAADEAWQARADDVADAYAEAVRDLRLDGAPLVRVVRAKRSHHVSSDDEGPEIVLELDPSLPLADDAFAEALGAPTDTGIPWVHIVGVGIGVSPATASPEWVRNSLASAVDLTIKRRDAEASAQTAEREQLAKAERALRAALELHRPP